MSLKAWARRQSSIDLTMDLVLAISLFALAIPLIMSLGGSTISMPRDRDLDLTSSQPVQALRQAIIGQESEGRCTIQNGSGSGAAGLAQVMPENVKAWSQEAFGHPVSLNEFLSNCKLQLRLIEFKLTQYWRAESQSGTEAERVRRVSARWYAGSGDLFDSATPQSWNGNPYPSVREYTLSVLKRYQEIVSTSRRGEVKLMKKMLPASLSRGVSS